MLKNYIKIALRNFKRQKLYSIINVIGLSIGLTVSIIIILFVTNEINFDKFNHNYKRIARIITTSQSLDKSLRNYSLTPGILGEKLKEEYPEIEDYTTIIDRYTWGRFTVEHNRNKYYESDYLITEPSFLKMFDFKILAGDKNSLLTEPNEMVLTKSTAKKLFGDKNPVGKTIKTDRSWGDFKVTGILKDPPKNSHLQFSMLISMKSLIKLEGFNKALHSFNYDIVRTYLLFKPGYKPLNFSGKLKEFQNSYKIKNSGTADFISLQPLSDIHFNSQNIEFDLNSNPRSKTTLYILAIIGLLIIFIAAINYTNLTTAKSITRMKEIGIRKVVGADKNQLIQQYLTEAVLVTFVALFTAVLIVELILPAFNNFTGKSLSFMSRSGFPEIAFIIFLTLFVGLFSGIFPALLITKSNTILFFQGSVQPKSRFSLIGKGLVVIQFAVSIMMIFCTLTIYKQLKYIQNKELGFNKDNMLIVDINSSGTRNNFITMKNEFSRNPDVKNITVSSRIPGDWKTQKEIKAHNFGEDKKYDKKMFYIGADYDFIKTFGIALLEGRNFHNSYSGDSTNIIINREAAVALGLSDPIGKSIVISDDESEGVYKIIGLVKDFNFQSLHEKISPMIIGYWNNPFISIDYFTARIGGRNIPGIIKYFVSVQNNFDKITPFEYNFLDRRIEEFYNQDKHEAVIVNTASGLAMLIACLGLFGLTAFSAQKRTKEIGVRKVLGASITGILVMFSGNFLKLVLFACFISLPVSYYLMQKWLNEFAYRINIDITIFLFSGIIALIIAIITISFQAIKAAVSNPVESLRYE